MSSRHTLSALSAALLALAASTGEAAAANGPNLTTSIGLPAAVSVDQTGRYTVTVANIGNRDATGIQLVITLPDARTSPQNYLLGTLGARSGICAVSGYTLTCGLGTLRGGRSTSVYFDLALPYSAAASTIRAVATEVQVDLAPANNTATRNANPLPYALDVGARLANLGGSATVDNDHCTGRDLISFYQCELFPSSISSHTAVFASNGTIDLGDPSYTGVWSQSAADHLEFTYSQLGNVVASFAGVGVDGTNCFEGITTFPGSAYNSAYLVCLP